ncbi:hypothetical protein RQP46_004844 [Phenoliferia psychrophenolica]
MATHARSHFRLLLALLLSLAPSLLATAGPQVKLTTGTIEGFYNGTMEVFLGVPFAAPPVGSLRFRAPQSPAAHSGVLATKTWSDGCHQIKPDYPFENTEFSEDCLYMNIWRSGPATGTPVPILFWIHGGAYMNGHALGTIAGAGSIATHILFSNPAEGLFRAAVMTSGNHIAGPIQIPKLAEVSVGSLPPLYNATGCSDLECLRAAPADTLFTGISTWINATEIIGDRLPFPPVLGGYISELPSLRLASTSRAGSLPTLITQVTDEGTIFTTPLLGTTPSLYEGDEYITDTPEFAAYNNYKIQNSTFTGLDELYTVTDTSLLSPYGTNGSVNIAVGVPVSPYVMRTTAMTGDLMVVSPRRSWLAAAIARGTEAKRQWSYRYNVQNPAFPAFLGVYHVSDLYMLFGQNPSSGDNATDVKFAALAQDMQQALINFVTNMDPQLGYKKRTTLAFAWEPYYIAKRLLLLNSGSRTLEADTFRKTQTDFIASLVPQMER